MSANSRRKAQVLGRQILVIHKKRAANFEDVYFPTTMAITMLPFGGAPAHPTMRCDCGWTVTDLPTDVGMSCPRCETEVKVQA